MRRGKINEVSFCAKIQMENDSNQPQLSAELGRNNKRKVSRNAELMFFSSGSKDSLKFLTEAVTYRQQLQLSFFTWKTCEYADIPALHFTTN